MPRPGTGSAGTVDIVTFDELAGSAEAADEPTEEPGQPAGKPAVGAYRREAS